ncbi:hypothetical protein V5O48_006103 [Marasmius crinis-equi]|uniref:Uncharacterized protein n=1 Tax=Marasmius crinis-equi TaxID=585013 RepID=A0ABR3FKP6_9AGAR
MHSSPSSNASSGPSQSPSNSLWLILISKTGTPTRKRTVTKSRSEVIEEKTPDRVVYRSVTYSRTEVVTETPKRNHGRGRRSSVPTLVSLSDSEDSTTCPPSPSSPPESQHDFTTRSESPTSSRLSSSIPSTSSLSPSVENTTPSHPDEPIPRAETDDAIEAYYQSRYPGKVPHPDSYRSLPVNIGSYHVISAGTSVGIFTDWTHASHFVLGVSKNRHKEYRFSWQAWLAYRHAWESKHVRVLGQYQDTAPLETQLEDMTLGGRLADIITREQSDDLLRVVTSQAPGCKSIYWQLSGPSVQGSTYVDLSRIVLWIDDRDLDGAGAGKIEHDLQDFRNTKRKLTILFLGFDHPDHEDMLSMLIPRLEMQYRAHCLPCQSVTEGLKHVYSMSLAMNPYHVVQQHSSLFNSQLKCTYIRALLQLDGVSVPQVKRVVERFPSWRTLHEYLQKAPDGALPDDGEDTWIWEQLRNL